MTVGLVCIAFVAIRILEEFARFCFRAISNLVSKKKDDKVVVREWKRLSACVSPELHGMIKAHAQWVGLTITDYILVAINEKPEREHRG